MDKISHYSLLSTVLKGVGRRRRLTNFSCSILIPWINILQNTKYSMPDWTLSQWTSQFTLMANPLSHRSHSLLWLPSQDLQHGSIENLAGSYRLILSRSNQSLTTHLGKCDWAQLPRWLFQKATVATICSGFQAKTCKMVLIKISQQVIDWLTVKRHRLSINHTWTKVTLSRLDLVLRPTLLVLPAPIQILSKVAFWLQRTFYQSEKDHTSNLSTNFYTWAF